MWLTSTYESEKIIAGCIYRPPPSQFSDKTEDQKTIDQIMKSIESAKNLVSSKKAHSILIAGDIKLLNARWFPDGSVSVSGPKNNPAELLIDILDELGITQFVTFPTFIQADGTSKKTLDNVISDNDMRVSNIKSDAPLGSRYNPTYLYVGTSASLSSLVQISRVSGSTSTKMTTSPCVNN